MIEPLKTVTEDTPTTELSFRVIVRSNPKLTVVEAIDQEGESLGRVELVGTFPPNPKLVGPEVIGALLTRATQIAVLRSRKS